MSKYIGLIGYPIKHSISPCFQQAALDYYHLDICYQAWETSSGRLGPTINSLRESQNLGANVTVPYKQAVLPLLDEIDYLAGLIGAVNTIVKRENKLLGFNTDAQGFVQGLYQEGCFNPEGKQAVVLGAGGAARAVCFALVQQKVDSLVIINRNLLRAKALAEGLRSYIKGSSTGTEGLRTEITTLPWRSLSSEGTFHRCQLIVNCTSVGMRYGSSEGQSPLTTEVIPREVLIYDLVYNPRPTPLLQSAQEAGANTLGGLAMLVYQGAASFELWTGKKAPMDIMLSRETEMLIGEER